MSVKVASKKVLAIVLSVAMLASCMVFSFSASAADQLMWENDFDNPSSSNWFSILKGESDVGPWNSGTYVPGMYASANYAVYKDGGHMALGFKTWNSRKYLSGFMVRHKEATDKNADAYGSAGGAIYETGVGNFQPNAGRYKIQLDYKLNAMPDDASSIIDICVGFACADAFYWDGDRDLNRFVTAGTGGIYETVASVRLSDLGTGWQSTETYIDIADDGKKMMHVFLKTGFEGGSLDNAEVLVDNIKVYLAGEDLQPDEDSVKMWENDFGNPNSSNWHSILKGESDVGPWNTGTVVPGTVVPGMYSGANYAVYKDGGYMALGFKSWNARKYLSGFMVRHREATDKSITDAYGSAGGAIYETGVGNFQPNAGRYKVELDYKLNAMPDDASSIIDICVGFACADAFYWDGDRDLDRFMTAGSGGTYETVASVRLGDLGTGWQNTVTYIDVTGDGNKMMHVFLKTGFEDGSLDGAEVLIDNIVIYKENDVELPPVYTGPIKMWQNTFQNGNTLNWASAYGGKEDGSYWNSGKVHTEHKNYSVIASEGDNSFMSLGFANDVARNKLSGFVFLHEEETHNFSGQYGYGGGLPGTPYGRVNANPGYYQVSLDYKLASITDASNASFDFYVSFCNDLLWDGSSGMDLTRLGAFGGDPHKLFTVTANDLNQDWKNFTFDLTNLTNESMFIYFFVMPSADYAGSLEGSELWIDNIEFTLDMDEEKFTYYTFYYNGKQVGKSAGSLPGMYFAMPELNLPEIPDGHKVVFYSDSQCTNMISAPTAYPDVSKSIYIRIVQDTGNTWGFETEAGGVLLSMNPRIPETIITTDKTVAHSGTGSARVNSDGGLGSPNLYPQMTIQNGFGKKIEMGKGRNYVVQFYLYVPANQSPYEISYWLTATEDETIFNKDYDDPYSSKNFLLAEGTQMINTVGEWVEVSVSIPDCPYSGFLRLGLNGDRNADHPFYVDDINVISMPADPDAWSFETEGDDTLLSLNPRIPETTIYTDASSAVFSGISAARINSDGGLGSPNLYPQMLVKNGAGEQVYVYASRSYEMSFHLFVPNGQPYYDITYWLAATDEETVFNKDYEDAYSCKNYMVAEGTYAPSAAGEWLEVVIPITESKYTGKLRIGFNGCGKVEYPFYIDDVVVKEVTKEADANVESFERYEADQVLSLNTNNASITVSDGDRLSGDFGAEVITVGNNVVTAPQMVVNDYRAKPVTLEKGKDYYVSFWVSQPIDQPDYDLLYWLAVTDSNAAFTTARENVVVDTKTVAIKNKQAWQRVSVEINDCAYSGALRLGITGSTDVAHLFYIDDIYVKEILPTDGDAMNFEGYEIGTTLHLNEDDNTFTVTDKESYTGGQSVLVHADNNHENRPQMIVRDADGKPITVKKGDNFYVSFMVLIPETEPYFSFSYYVAATSEEDSTRAFRYRTSFVSTNYKLPGDQFGITPPDAGVWTEIKIAVLDCPHDGVLRIGLCHGNGHPFSSNFYVDDIKVYEPEFVLVKFDTNGSEDKYEDLLLLSDMLIPYDGIDPYREGYEFMGWYTSKDFDKNSYFDVYSMPITGKTGDVVTLYARWREWDEKGPSNNREDNGQLKVEYYTDKVWVGDQNVPESPYTSGEFAIGEAEPIVIVTDPIVEGDVSLPPWLIVVIIIGAVTVVGGGAVLAAILFKKKKKES